MAPPPAPCSRRHQGLDAARFERRHRRTVGIAVVRQHRLGPAQSGRDRLDVRHQLVAVAGAVGDPSAHDQLRAQGIHHGLRIVGLAELMPFALAHQPAVRVAQVALLVPARRPLRRLRPLALGPALAPGARRYLGLVVRPLRLRARPGPGLETPTGGVQAVARGLPPRDLPGQRLRVLGGAIVRRLGTLHQSGDLQPQLFDQLPRPPVRDRAMLARIGLELAAVHAHHAQLHQLQLLGQKQNLKEALAHRRHVVATGCALDPTARKDPVGIAVDQQGQHHPGVILRRARATTVHLEGVHVDALDRLDHEVRQIILRDPIPKIGRKQKRLVPPAIHESAHSRILTEHQPNSPTDC